MGMGMKKTLRAVALALLLGLGVALLMGGSAASQDARAVAGADEITLNETNDGQTVELRGDQIFVIDLEGNPSTGYTWAVAEVDDTILRQVGEVEFEPYSPDLIGSPGRQHIRLRAVAGGQTDLMLAYRRPWETAAPLKTFSVQVQTTGPFAQIEEAATATPVPLPSPEDLGPIAAEAVPSAFNWCDHGGCTVVKDQGACGSCWAFATSGVVESLIRIDDGVTRDLSEQYLVSCNIDGWGCAGGSRAFAYFINRVPPGEPEAGAVYEADYPYLSGLTGVEGPCAGQSHTHHEKLISWSYVGISEYPSVADVKQAIYDHGPVYVSVCASGPVFNGYSGGVYETDESRACGGLTDHGVVLVGWDDGQGSNGVWVLKNSWDTGWGENGGYMRIGYGISNVGRWPAYAVYGDINHSPDTPSDPSPADGAVDQAIDTDLSWTGGDPDTGDVVTYDVYLKLSTSPTYNLICNDVSTTTCNLGTLLNDTSFDWYVVATDNHGWNTTGPVWSFTTRIDSGPLVYSSHTIDDNLVGDSNGNNDGIVNCGETIELWVVLYNEGTATATGATAAITSTSVLVTWPHNTSSSYPDIAAGGTGTNINDFEFTVHPLTRDGYVITFNLTTAANGGTWTDSFSVTVACDVDYPTVYLPLAMRNYNSAPVPANGDFENGPDGSWSEYSSHGYGLILNSSELVVSPHGGNWAVWLGGAPNETSILARQVTVPSNATALGYWHYIASNDSCGSEYIYVRFGSTTLVTHDLCQPSNTYGWAYRQIDVTAWRGQSVQLRFATVMDGDANNSNFFLDDVHFSTGDTAPLDASTLPELSLPPGVDPAATRERR